MFVSEINILLSDTLDEEGITAWWLRPRMVLRGRSAATAWKDGDKAEVYNLAQDTR